MKINKFVYVAVAVIMMMAISKAGGRDDKQSGLKPIKLFERDGECFSIGWKAVSGAPRTQQEWEKALPRLFMPANPAVEGKEEHPLYAELFEKYPLLTKRQREVDQDKSLVSMGRGLRHANPLYQMRDRWIRARRGGDFHEMDMDGRIIRRSRISSLLEMHLYGKNRIDIRAMISAEWQSFTERVKQKVSELDDLEMSIPAFEPPIYKHPSADFRHAQLFYINGSFYSVYGDTQVAKHVSIEGHPDHLGARRYAENLLYAYSEELPPALQSCGVDGHAFIWLADIEGHMVFFDTKSKEFIQEVVVFEDATSILIPENNLSFSVFVFKEDNDIFQEYHIEVGADPVVEKGNRSISPNVQMVLYSDGDKIVYVTSEEAVIITEDSPDGRSMCLNLPEKKRIMEGVYLPEFSKVCLLIADKPQDPDCVFDVREQSWETKRIHQLNLSD